LKVLVIGSLGTQGRRYCAILKYLDIEHIGYDIVDSFNSVPCNKITHAIIATPIDTHYHWCLWCVENKIPFLCEKPISKNIDEIETIKRECKNEKVDGRMVCNWAFVLPYKNSNLSLNRHENTIVFDYFNTGKDGIYDLIQPIYLSDEISSFKFKSPVYNCKINGAEVDQRDFDASYSVMLGAWFSENINHLWSMDDAIKATEKLLSWKGNLKHD
jgi:Ulp1 family protease